jgi:ribonucleoside-triphosphate reductase
MLTIPSVRADLITRRTYNRQKSDGIYENWSETVARTIEHQKWLWERALKRDLNKLEKIELEQLRELIENRKALVAGRTL